MKNIFKIISLFVPMVMLCGGGFVGQNGGLKYDITTILTATGATTTLTNTSNQIQIASGGGNQIFLLPNATTIKQGLAWLFKNQSSANVTIKDNGAILQKTLSPYQATMMIPWDVTTNLGKWSAFDMPGTTNIATQSLVYINSGGLLDSVATGAANCVPTWSGTSWSCVSSGSSGKVYSWSGYFQNNCSWTVSSASYNDFSTINTCTLTEEINNNWGSTPTITTSGGAGNFLPGLHFTPPITGTMEICFTAIIDGNTANRIIAIKLTDGSVDIGEFGFTIPNTALLDNVPQSISGCKQYSATSGSAIDIKFQGRSNSSGSININDTQGTMRAAIEWSLKYPGKL